MQLVLETVIYKLEHYLKRILRGYLFSKCYQLTQTTKVHQQQNNRKLK